MKDVKISQLLSHIYRPSIHEYSMKKRFDQMSSQSVLWGYLISSTVSTVMFSAQLSTTDSGILEGFIINIYPQRQRFPYI